MERPILRAILSCEGTKLTDNEKRLFSEYNPLGISLFGRNIETQEQVKSLIEEIKNAINRENVLICVDEEGGRVSRLDSISEERYVSQEALAKVDKKYSIYHAKLIGNELRKVGINVNYSPVIDRKTRPQNKVLKSRCFSGDVKIIEEYGKLIAETYIKMGICPCIKHMPGHFSSLNDPHLSIPISDLPLKEIEKKISYMRNFNKYPLAMTSHILLRSIDGNNVATQSEEIITKIIRNYIGFDGFLLSDAIDMHALQGSISERVASSIDAGIDAVCCCSGRYEDIWKVCQRLKKEKSRIRFAKIEKVFHNKQEINNIKVIRKHYEEALKTHLNQHYSYDATEVLHQMLKKGESL